MGILLSAVRSNGMAIFDSIVRKYGSSLSSSVRACPLLSSVLAKTNNGIYSIMDIKSHNKDRLMNLHGVISDNIHKVEYIEERINSLFFALA